MVTGQSTQSLPGPGVGGLQEETPEARQEVRYLHSALWTGDWRHLAEQTGHQHWGQREEEGQRQTRQVSSCWPGEKTVGDSVRISSPAEMSRIAIKCLEDETL